MITPEKKSMGIVIGVAALIICAGIALTVQRYMASQQALGALKSEKMKLAQLQNDMEETRRSIDKMKKEQEEFQAMLFNERDVPAFLDGISASAAKASVYVQDMKTQQFSEVTLPKDKVGADGKLVRSKDYDDFEEKKKNTPQQELNQMLTLAAMPINIKIQGSFESIVNFLNSIESYRQLLTVSNVQITSRTDYPQLNCDFTLKIYSLKTLKDIKP